MKGPSLMQVATTLLSAKPDGPQAIPEEATYTPINSAGEHEGQQKVVDVVLLFLCLAVPFILYIFIRMGERRESLRVLETSRNAVSSMIVEGHAAEPSSPCSAGSGTGRANFTATGPPAGTAEAEGTKTSARGGEVSDTPRTGLREKIPRIGSQYHMERQTGKMNFTPVSSLMTKADLKEPSEGTPLENILAGFSTAMAALPDAISFSFITGVSPLNGIWAGVFMGLSAALVGGRPGMISSASAATAVVLADISTDRDLGMGPMALCVFLVGILQLFAGWLRLSRFITLIPHSVMLGFVNGLAIIMVRAQMRQFHQQGDGPWVDGDICVSMCITAVFAIVVAMGWNRIPKVGKILPAPLASVILTAVFSIVFADLLPRRTLKDVAGAHTFRGGLSTMPSWNFPPQNVDWQNGHMWWKVISIAIRFAIVGLLESLMTESLIDQITGTSGSMRRECFGQGVGNILSSFFGTQGGCALIAQSLMNVGSGGRSRLSGVSMGVSLGVCVVVLAPLMAEIPVAALVGLIVLIAVNTFCWSSIALILRINWTDSMVVIVVTVMTVWQDLAVAVVVGVIMSGLSFAWVSAAHVQVESISESATTRCFSIRGPMFFGSAMNFRSEVTKTFIPENVVVMDFTNSRVLDISGTDAIAKTREYLVDQGKRVVLKGLSEEVLRELPKEARDDCENVAYDSEAQTDYASENDSVAHLDMGKEKAKMGLPPLDETKSARFSGRSRPDVQWSSEPKTSNAVLKQP